MSDALALSALDWWTEAGIDTIVDDLPHDWLSAARQAEPVPASVAPGAVAVPAAVAAPAFPAILADFRRWLLADAGVPGPAAARVDATGDPAGGVMVIVDMPETGDRAAGALLSGEAGALFDRMLGAIRLERAALYLAPFSPARPTIGRLKDADCDRLAPFMRHHIALAAPKRLLVLGDAPVKALFGKPLPEMRGEVRSLEIGGVPIPTVASIHPRLVLERPDYRKPVWADLQLFMAL